MKKLVGELIFYNMLTDKTNVLYNNNNKNNTQTWRQKTQV